MNVCPDCRAGKEWIETTQTEDSIFRITIDYECMRCGHTKEEQIRV